MDEEREERRRLERVAVGRICGCKSCVCCKEFERDTARKKWLMKFHGNVLTNTQTDSPGQYVFDPKIHKAEFVPPKTLEYWDSFKKERSDE